MLWSSKTGHNILNGQHFFTGAIGSLVSSALFLGIGEYFGDNIALFSVKHLKKIALHAVVGGAKSYLEGGKFGHGFASAGVTQGFAPTISDIDSYSLRIVSAAVLGGTASALSGGSFSNGAETAAFSRLFNDELHKEETSDEVNNEEQSSTQQKSEQEKQSGNIENNDTKNNNSTSMTIEYDLIETNCTDFKCEYKKTPVKWLFVEEPREISWHEARAINDQNQTVLNGKLFGLSVALTGPLSATWGARIGSMGSTAIGAVSILAAPVFRFDGGDIISTSVEVWVAPSISNDDSYYYRKTLNVTRDEQKFTFITTNY